MRTNAARPTTPPPRTHGGAVASRITALQQLERTVFACLLWEDSFYESGVSVADRIKQLVPLCDAVAVGELAIKAREEMKLRHVPLLLLREMVRAPAWRLYAGSEVLPRVIKRADELAEFLALYWKEGKQPLAAAVKRGLARVLPRFDAYQLGKHRGDGKTVSLRDVMFLTHPKPKDAEQADRLARAVAPVARRGYRRGAVQRHATEQGLLWRHVAERTLRSHGTWERDLSDGKNPKEAFEALLREGKLGYLALLRNLRNMVDAGVDGALVRAAILARRGAGDVLPFRFLTAAKAAPRYEAELDAAMLAVLADVPKLPGKTVVVVDVSGSMYHDSVSEKSELTRAHAACVLAATLREVCEHPVIYATAGSDFAREHATQLVPARRGMALVDFIHGLCGPLGGGGIFLTQVMQFLHEQEGGADRVIVITDEQDCENDDARSPNKAPTLGRHNYVLNVGTYKRGIAYERWTHVSGFSEHVVRFIAALEGGGIGGSGQMATTDSEGGEQD